MPAGGGAGGRAAAGATIDRFMAGNSAGDKDARALFGRNYDKAQRLRNAIIEGEQRLKTKRDSLGKRLPAGMINAIEKSISNARAELAQLAGG